MSGLSVNLSFTWTLVSSLAVASCRRRCGVGMLLRTGSHGRGVERRAPMIVAKMYLAEHLLAWCGMI